MYAIGAPSVIPSTMERRVKMESSASGEAVIATPSTTAEAQLALIGESWGDTHVAWIGPPPGLNLVARADSGYGTGCGTSR